MTDQQRQHFKDWNAQNQDEVAECRAALALALDLEDVEKERDALAAENERLREALEYIRDCPGGCCCPPAQLAAQGHGFRCQHCTALTALEDSR